MRTPTISLISAALVLSALGPARGQDDPDRAVAGGQIPVGWSVRLDRADAKMENVRVVTMGSGLHVTLGPAVILYREGDRASGAYRVSASFTQTKPARHPEAYGLFIGGSDLQGAGQAYTYFLVRQDGKFLVKRRAGSETSTVVDWSAHPAVKAIEGEGSARNELAIAVGADRVTFSVNGAEVASAERGKVDAEGIYGYRVNHNLDVHLNPIALSRGGASR